MHPLFKTQKHETKTIHVPIAMAAVYLVHQRLVKNRRKLAPKNKGTMIKDRKLKERDKELFSNIAQRSPNELH